MSSRSSATGTEGHGQDRPEERNSRELESTAQEGHGAGKARLHWIVAASVVFYAFARHWWIVIPMLVTTTIDYVVAITIRREARPRRRA